MFLEAVGSGTTTAEPLRGEDNFCWAVWWGHSSQATVRSKGPKKEQRMLVRWWVNQFVRAGKFLPEGNKWRLGGWSSWLIGSWRPNYRVSQCILEAMGGTAIGIRECLAVYHSRINYVQTQWIKQPFVMCSQSQMCQKIWLNAAGIICLCLPNDWGFTRLKIGGDLMTGLWIIWWLVY